ncbi:MAG: hypothetical protein MUC77_04945 [Chromatiaceae bacterium]|jgi:hypothetical protein|nr:hypothetical protein [Chromatiaceae bacterium]
MTRGIHLKRLKIVDLELLGLADGAVAEGEQPGLLAEVDPVLSGVIAEVRTELEATRRLLDQALAAAGKPEPGH